MKLLLDEVPTRQVLVLGWYCLRSYQSGWFFNTGTNTSLYAQVPTWYSPNTDIDHLPQHPHSLHLIWEKGRKPASFVMDAASELHEYMR
jgi:hypothetical protein